MTNLAIVTTSIQTAPKHECETSSFIIEFILTLLLNHKIYYYIISVLLWHASFLVCWTVGQVFITICSEIFVIKDLLALCKRAAQFKNSKQ